MMSLYDPLLISRQLLGAFGTHLFVHHADRIPQESPILVISNHRSFMDAPVLMAAMKRSVRFACHHYMGQVPLMRELVTRFGCFPLDSPDQRQQSFFGQAIELLQTRQVVGIFPEGAQPMVQYIRPQEITPFHRGFAHLALRASVADLAVLPVAIAAHQETNNMLAPLKLFSWFDPSEPLFNQPGWHPMVIYQRVNVLIGHPIWINPTQQQQYQGKQARRLVADLTNHCHAEISSLLDKDLR
jgi:1-acyl-sn-glycerol-3-phosphate acyltransferase